MLHTIECSIAIVALLFSPGSASQRPTLLVGDGSPQTMSQEQGSGSDNLPGTAKELDQAKALLDKGSLNEAEAAVRQYLEHHADSAQGHFLLGLILFRQQKPQNSLKEFTQGAKFHDPSAVDLKVVALDYVLLGAYADADHWLTRSVEMDANDAQAWYYLGRTKYNENRFEEAVQAFKQCLRLDPKNVKAEDNLGLSFQGLGRTDEAASAYRNAISWQKLSLNKQFGPSLDLGTLLLEQDRAEEAVSYLREAAEISPKESKPHEQLGKAYSRLNELPMAQAELEKAVALSPDTAALHFMLGQVYRKQGMSDKAKVELERGAALNKSSHQPAPPAIEN